MASTVRTHEPGETPIGEGRPSASEIKKALSQILESQPFRTSKQCQNLFRYVVDHSMSEDDSALKERIIGAEVFGRELSYDTNDDPVVRVRAADVRKRLAQYYQSLEPGTEVLHFELLPGSYRVHFRCSRPHEAIPLSAIARPEGAQSPLPHAERENTWRTSKTIKIAGLVLTAISLVFAVRWFQSMKTSPQERFWAPLMIQKQPVLIYLGANVAYIYSSSYLAKYRAAHGMANNGPEFFVDLPPGTMVSTDDVIPVKDTFVTTADVSAIVEITTQLGDWNKPFVVRSGSDLSIGDLRNRPSVMIGAFNNRWTLELTNDLPYRFRQGVKIENRDHPDRSWSVPTDTRNSTTDDYALVTRLLKSKTGGPSMTVAGIGEYGTQAAAEFLTNRERIGDFLKTAPVGWENKNMQAVLHVKVVDYQPISVDVVATSYW